VASHSALLRDSTLDAISRPSPSIPSYSSIVTHASRKTDGEREQRRIVKLEIEFPIMLQVRVRNSFYIRESPTFSVDLNDKEFRTTPSRPSKFIGRLQNEKLLFPSKKMVSPAKHIFGEVSTKNSHQYLSLPLSAYSFSAPHSSNRWLTCFNTFFTAACFGNVPEPFPPTIP